MDSSGVLTALQEWERWQARKARLEERLEELRRRRATLEEDLEAIRRNRADLAELLFEPGDRPVDPQLLPPFHLGR